ncbi:MAG TPA: hypothetical protein VF559_05895 [Caulobacteraceae bacterium]
MIQPSLSDVLGRIFVVTDFTLGHGRSRPSRFRLAGLRAVEMAVFSAGALLVAFIGAVSGMGLG